MTGMDLSGDSFIVSHYGLDGQREHMMPGNRRRGTPARAKRGYSTEAEAREAMERNRPGGSVYRCSICDDWHMAIPAREPERGLVPAAADAGRPPVRARCLGHARAPLQQRLQRRRRDHHHLEGAGMPHLTIKLDVGED